MRRFTSDLLRVLKSQPNKQITITEFPSAFERVILRPFNPVDYGLCTLEDLVDEVPENTVLISRGTETFIVLPKREQTAQEVVLTKQFADDVVKLLSWTPQCSMLFNKFIPAYHHHFGVQCKISDYGFTKLIELFEAIPDTVKIEETIDGERMISLTLPKALQVLGKQIVHLVKCSRDFCMPIEMLPIVYHKEFYYPLKLSTYECSDYEELISKLSEYVKLIENTEGPIIVLADSNAILTVRFWSILTKPLYSLPMSNFINKYNVQYNATVTKEQIEQMTDVVDLKKTKGIDYYVELKKFFILAWEIYHIIYDNGGTVFFNQLENKYRKKLGRTLNIAEFNYSTLEELIGDLQFLLIIRGTRKRMSLILNEKLVEFGVELPPNMQVTKSNASTNVASSVTSNVMANIKSSNMKKETRDVSTETSNYLKLNENVNVRRISPPKPDSPQSPRSEEWNKWNTPNKHYSINLSIDLPVMKTPQLTVNTSELISPTKTLLSAHDFSVRGVVAGIAAPEPDEVPMPDKLLGKGMFFVCF